MFLFYLLTLQVGTFQDTHCQKYSETKDVERLRARGHSIAVETIRILTELGHRTGVCEICGSVERLEVHHNDLNWLNNTPSNLQLLCNKCHTKVHSSLPNEDKYEESFKVFADIINK